MQRRRQQAETQQDCQCLPGRHAINLHAEDCQLRSGQACSQPPRMRAYLYVLLCEGHAGVARPRAIVAQLAAVAAFPLHAEHAVPPEGPRRVGIHHRTAEPDGEPVYEGVPAADLLLPQAAPRQHRLRLPCPPGCLRGRRPWTLQVPAQAPAGCSCSCCACSMASAILS